MYLQNVVVKDLVGIRVLSLIQNFQTDSGAQSVPYLVSAEGSFPGGKVAVG